MELIFLGTTAAIPSSERNHSGVALKFDREVILFDCGEAAQAQLIRSRTSYMRINKIFISHLHGDHFLGLPGLIQTLGFAGREVPLSIYGPPGIRELVHGIFTLGYFQMGFPIELIELEDEMMVEEEKYIVKALKVDHFVPAFGFVFEEKKERQFQRDKAEALGIPPGPFYSRLKNGETVEFQGKTIHSDMVLGKKKRGVKIVYSGDTLPMDNITLNCRDAILIHEATFDTSLKDHALENYHTTTQDAAKTAKEGGARILFMTHISPRYKNPEILENQAREVFPNSHVAHDLLKVNVRKVLEL